MNLMHPSAMPEVRQPTSSLRRSTGSGVQLLAETCLSHLRQSCCTTTKYIRFGAISSILFLHMLTAFPFNTSQDRALSPSKCRIAATRQSNIQHGLVFHLSSRSNHITQTVSCICHHMFAVPLPRPMASFDAIADIWQHQDTTLDEPFRCAEGAPVRSTPFWFCSPSARFSNPRR